MFYERPIALNRERHQSLKLAVVPDHFRFAARTNAVPIMSTEFAEAARDYPIVFVGEEGGSFSVAALVGVRDRENLMIDAAGQWAPGTYLPAFARRYPFVLATTGTADTLTVCIDEVYPGLGVSSGEALFQADGQETPYLRRMLEFLQAFHGEAQRTADFANRLKALGLLVPKVIHVDRKGQPQQSLRGLWIVDTARLRGIDDARVVELFRSGALAWIEAHLLSLGNLARLVARLEGQADAGEEGEAALSTPAVPAPAPLKH
jgi:hypothetical protein